LFYGQVLKILFSVLVTEFKIFVEIETTSL